MTTAAIAIDPWKQDIFTRHLTQSGYTFTTHPGSQFTLLKVETTNMEALAGVIMNANAEAARTGAPQ